MTEVSHPRANWESVGSKWFRKTQLYTAVFDQDLDLDNYIVACAPYAGALGMLLLFTICGHVGIFGPDGGQRSAPAKPLLSGKADASQHYGEMTASSRPTSQAGHQSLR